jgi:hypothetical protein
LKVNVTSLPAACERVQGRSILFVLLVAGLLAGGCFTFTQGLWQAGRLWARHQGWLRGHVDEDDVHAAELAPGLFQVQRGVPPEVRPAPEVKFFWPLELLLS